MDLPFGYNSKTIKMADKEWFKHWFNSPFYHKLYFERDENEARYFIEKLLQHLHPGSNNYMLDAACGRGRHSKVLAAKGYNVVGVDLSPESIRYAKQFETGHLSFYVHDLRMPFWINYFHYVFNFFTSFGYFSTRREHDNTIRTLAASLKPSGKLVIDFLNVPFSESHLIANEIKEIDGTRFEINRWQNDTSFFKEINITDPSLPEPLSFTEVVAKLTLGDFTEMLSSQKLQIKEVFGTYSLHPYDIKTSPRLIMIAQKAA